MVQNRTVKDWFMICICKLYANYLRDASAWCVMCVDGKMEDPEHYLAVTVCSQKQEKPETTCDIKLY